MTQPESVDDLNGMAVEAADGRRLTADG